jgi:hypothetical protein
MDEFTIYLPFPEPWDYIAIPVRLALVLVAPPIGLLLLMLVCAAMSSKRRGKIPS